MYNYYYIQELERGKQGTRFEKGWNISWSVGLLTEQQHKGMEVWLWFRAQVKYIIIIKWRTATALDLARPKHHSMLSGGNSTGI